MIIVQVSPGVTLRGPLVRVALGDEGVPRSAHSDPRVGRAARGAPAAQVDQAG